MAHEIEMVGDKACMAFTGETPWHGLGQELPEDTDTETFLSAAGLDWEVELATLKDNKGQDVPARAVRRTTDNKILGVVGLQYHSLQNNRSFAFFQPFLDEKLASLHTAGSLMDGKKVWVLAKINRDPIVVGKTDEVEKFVLLSNSHDGTTSVRVGFTPVRVVCHNTLSMAHGTKSGSQLIRVRHTKNMETSLENLRDIIDLVDRQFTATAEQFNALVNKTINQRDLNKYVRKVFDIKMDAKLNGQQTKMLDTVFQLFEKGKGNDTAGVKGTYWAAYNGITEYINWERGNTQDSRLTSLWFGASAATNQRALEIAFDMAT